MNDEALLDLAPRFVIISGYWISPAMIVETTPTTVVLSNGKVFNR